MFSLPSILLSFVIASLIGLFFFLLFGKGWLRLGVYWLIALVGFFIGQTAAAFFDFNFMAIGSVNVTVATITCLVALLLTRAFWKNEPTA
jgi:uncharacterized membrane protein YjjP (DUF1212 family)